MTLIMKNAKQLLDILCNIHYQVEIGHPPTTGICRAVFNGGVVSPDILLDTLQDMMKLWPSYSGNREYPVPSTTQLQPDDAYWLANRHKLLWSKDTAYGKLRIKLLEWLIDRCAKYVLLDALQKLKKGFLPTREAMSNGICYYIKCLDDSCRAKVVFTVIAVDWPKYSGCIAHPIPDPRGPSEAFYTARKAGNQWDATTAYGKLRWELVDYCIEQLIKELAD